MSTPRSRAMAIGFAIMLFSFGAGIHLGAGGFGLLLSFTGVLVGANLVAVSVRMDDHQAALDGARTLAALMRRNTAKVGLIMASCAVVVVSCVADPVLCLGMFALLLLGVSLINVGVRGE